MGLFVKAAYIDPFVSQRKHDALKRTMEQVLTDARTERERNLNDPNATDKHKEEVVRMVEDLEKLQLKRISERMEVV